ncbi:unnamed protein product [Allacma fusca]|uniref:Uncharacterized protein n=1 Tax=Allacma fusca TaxID=39272 RepID=A0A8J2LIH7_9HEXA|nr:unnamed protein product [Allacma fusca]
MSRRSLSTMPTHPSLYQYPSQKSQSGTSSVSISDATSYPVPMIVRSTISTHKHKENDEDVLKIQNVPLSPIEKPFLQCEIPIYLGQVSDNEKPPDCPNANYHHSEINFLKVMTIEEMCNKSRKCGFSRQDKIDLLNQLFPPREFTLDKSKWKLDVSKMPANSTDRMHLFRKFEAERNDKNCSSKGFCPIMNDMIQDLFDECIRQDILEHPERGILLVCIKNGLNRQALTLSALLENSQMKAGRVSVTLGAIIDQLNKVLEKDKTEIGNLEAKVLDLEHKLDALKMRRHEERKREQLKNHLELDYYKKFCTQAKEQVDLFEDPERHKHTTKHKNSNHHHGSIVDTKATMLLKKESAI